MADGSDPGVVRTIQRDRGGLLSVVLYAVNGVARDVRDIRVLGIHDGFIEFSLIDWKKAGISIFQGYSRVMSLKGKKVFTGES
jgi:hypothetical protein